MLLTAVEQDWEMLLKTLQQMATKPMPGHQQCHAPTMRGSSSQGCPLIRRMASAALTCDRGHSPAYSLRKPASARPSVPVGAPRKHRNAWRASNSQPVARSSTRATTSTTLARLPAIELLDLPGRQIAGYCTVLNCQNVSARAVVHIHILLLLRLSSFLSS